MRYFTEVELREQFRRSPFETFCLPGNSQLTQAAKQFLNEKGVRVVRAGLSPDGGGGSTGRGEQGEYTLPDGRAGREKPEHMTHLRGRSLVYKNNPVIRLRGRLDSLQARIIDTAIEAKSMGLGQLARQLEEMLDLARAVMRAEVTGEEMADPIFAGLDSATLREMSHHPERHMGVKHFLPSPGQGLMMSRLNLLRTDVRETELAAAQAFYRSDGETERVDIMATLNRMSSIVYIMMCRLLAGRYQSGGG